MIAATECFEDSFSFDVVVKSDSRQPRTQCVAEAENCASSSSLDLIERLTPPTAKWGLFSFGELVPGAAAAGTLTNRISACNGDRVLCAVGRHQRVNVSLCVCHPQHWQLQRPQEIAYMLIVSKILSVDRRITMNIVNVLLYSLWGEVTCN